MVNMRKIKMKIKHDARVKLIFQGGRFTFKKSP